jgi:hypothetical protein
MRIIAWLCAWLCCVVLTSRVKGFTTPSPPRQDRAWKNYRNSQVGYCFSYPSRWLKGDAYEGAGLFVETGEKKFSKPLGEIDVAVIQPAEAADPQSQTVGLAQDLETHFAVLKRFERAERVEMLDKRQMQLLGNVALFTKDRYYDPQDRATWLEELVLVRRNDRLFRLELECRADHAERFEPVFAHVLESFRVDWTQ